MAAMGRTQVPFSDQRVVMSADRQAADAALSPKMSLRAPAKEEYPRRTLRRPPSHLRSGPGPSWAGRPLHAHRGKRNNGAPRPHGIATLRATPRHAEPRHVASRHAAEHEDGVHSRARSL